MTACNALANSLIQRRLWVGSWVVACWSWHLPLGRVPKFGSGTKKMKRSKFSHEGFRNLILFLKVPGFRFFLNPLSTVLGERNGNGRTFFFSHVHDRTDGTTYMGAYAIALYLSNKVSIVLIRTDQMPSIHSAWFIWDHTDQSVARCYHIVFETISRSWYTQWL